MFGDDSFSLREELKRWKRAFVEKYGDSDLEEWEGEEVELEKLKSSLLAVPFLSEKRLIIIKNLLSSQKAESLKDLLPLFEKIPESTVLVLVEFEEPDKRTTVFKTLSSLASLRLFKKLEGAELNRWIQKRAEQHEGHLSWECATYLENVVGANLTDLDQELQKLCLFAAGEEITLEMIDDVCGRKMDQSIFKLTDQVARKDFAGALQTLEDLTNQGEEAGFIFSMIVRQFRLMLEMKALSEEGHPPIAIARKMELHPFVVSSTLRFAKLFTYDQLKSALRAFLEIDERLKTGRLPLKPREEDHFLLAVEKVLLNTFLS